MYKLGRRNLTQTFESGDFRFRNLLHRILLLLLAVAVDGNTEAPAVADWTSLSWTTVDAEGKTEVNEKKLLAKDILVSKNLSAYKFAERNDADAKKLISSIL